MNCKVDYYASSKYVCYFISYEVGIRENQLILGICKIKFKQKSLHCQPQIPE